MNGHRPLFYVFLLVSLLSLAQGNRMPVVSSDSSMESSPFDSKKYERKEGETCST